MSLYKRGDIWWIAIRHRGGRVRRSTRTADREAAQRKHDELKARLWQQKHTGRTLADALLLWTKAKPRSRAEMNALRQIRAKYPDRPLVDATEASLIEAFGAKRPGTYNKLVGIVRAALGLAVRAGWLERAPVIIKRKEPPGAVRFLSAAEWKALHAELPDHLKPMATFAVSTGLRWGNLSRLTWDRVSIKRRVAWVEAPEAKGRRALQIPLSRTAITALQHSGSERTGVVFRYEGKPLGSPKTAWRKAVARSGLDGFRWHDLRHTWASWHVQRGTPLAVLRELGGWRSMAMVQRYAHLAASHVAQFADNARPPRKERWVA